MPLTADRLPLTATATAAAAATAAVAAAASASATATAATTTTTPTTTTPPTPPPPPTTTTTSTYSDYCYTARVTVRRRLHVERLMRQALPVGGIDGISVPPTTWSIAAITTKTSMEMTRVTATAESSTRSLTATAPCSWNTPATFVPSVLLTGPGRPKHGNHRWMLITNGAFREPFWKRWSLQILLLVTS